MRERKNKRGRKRTEGGALRETRKEGEEEK